METRTVKMQIMCQMSDLSYSVATGQDINKIANFVKSLLIKYPNTDTEVSVNELEEIWKQL